MGVGQQQRPLAEIIQHQRRKREIEPRPADGLGAEMAHVGIQRFAARHRQHHASPAPRRRSRARARTAPAHRGDWRRAGSAGWRAMAMAPSTASTMNHSTITGPNTLPIFSVPRLCIRNSPTRMMRVMGMIQGPEVVRRAQAFHRRQHRDGGRQHAVAIEQRQAQQGRRCRWRSWPCATPGRGAPAPPAPSRRLRRCCRRA